jgi:lipid-A-disaccharide synthase
MVKIPRIGLVNVVAGREVAPEFIQNDLDPPKVAGALISLLEPDSAQRTDCLAGLAEVRGRLGSPGAAHRVAEMASELVP